MTTASGPGRDGRPVLLVLGATGTVGAPLVRLLAERGAAVRAAARTPGTADHSTVEPVRFDFTDPATWGAAFRGVTTMFVLRPPAVAHVGRDLLPALAAARSAGVQHVVFMSAPAARWLPLLPHARVERWLSGSGMDWTVLRPSFFDQNLITVHAPAVRERGELLAPVGQGRLAFVDAHDVAAVAATVMLDPSGHHGRVWHPTGAEALTFGEVAGIMTATLDRTITSPRVGLVAWRRRARRDLGLSPPLTAMTSVLYTSSRLGFGAQLTTDVADLLGRPPSTMAEFVRREREAFQLG